MKLHRILLLLAILLLGPALLGAPAARADLGPQAPTPLAPANGASVTVPFTLAWSAVSDPAGIVAYNWEVSPSSNFSPVIAQNSTSGQTQDTVSGLATGTYFWHVQAVNGSFVQGAWSQAQSFTVTGATAGELGSPTLNPLSGGSAFHPMESFSVTWSAVPGAASYSLDLSTDPRFPIATEIHSSNIPTTSDAIILGDSEPQGTWYVRVSAVNATGLQSVPSNVDTFTLSFNAPLPPPPTLLTPSNGATVPLPVNLTWTDVPNPQESGYVLEIADDSGFKTIEYSNNQITGAHWSVTSLSAGTKYWRVLSTQGDSDAAAAAPRARAARTRKRGTAQRRADGFVRLERRLRRVLLHDPGQHLEQLRVDGGQSGGDAFAVCDRGHAQGDPLLAGPRQRCRGQSGHLVGRSLLQSELARRTRRWRRSSSGLWGSWVRSMRSFSPSSPERGAATSGGICTACQPARALTLRIAAPAV